MLALGFSVTLLFFFFLFLHFYLTLPLIIYSSFFKISIASFGTSVSCYKVACFTGILSRPPSETLPLPSSPSSLPQKWHLMVLCPPLVLGWRASPQNLCPSWKLQNVTLFGNRVIADKIKMRSNWSRVRLGGWLVSLQEETQGKQPVKTEAETGEMCLQVKEKEELPAANSS